LAVVILLIIWILIRLFYLKEDPGVYDGLYCFNDKFLTVILKPITDFLSQHLLIRDLMLILGALFMDMGFLLFTIVYILRGNSWKEIFAIILFYGLRGSFQSISFLQIYDTFIMEYPGFPSLMVPYFRTADFYYSGHTGASCLLALSYRDWGYTPIFYVYIFSTFYEALQMSIIRAHYSIDIIFGFIAAHYLFQISAKFSRSVLDVYLPIFGEKKSVCHKK